MANLSLNVYDTCHILLGWSDYGLVKSLSCEQASRDARPFDFPTTKGVADIGTCSVELREGSTSRIISTSQINNESWFRDRLSLIAEGAAVEWPGGSRCLVVKCCSNNPHPSHFPCIHYAPAGRQNPVCIAVAADIVQCSPNYSTNQMTWH